MSSINDLTNLKQRMEDVKQEADRAAGALSQIMSRLKKGFDCGTIEDAEKLLSAISRETDKAEQEFENSLAEFESKYEDVLEDKDNN